MNAFHVARALYKRVPNKDSTLDFTQDAVNPFDYIEDHVCEYLFDSQRILAALKFKTSTSSSTAMLFACESLSDGSVTSTDSRR